MSAIGQAERQTQNRVVALFRDELGYRYLGDWSDRDGNSNVEEALLSDWLTRCGHPPAHIAVALHKLRTESDNHNRTLYGNNQAVYKLLRYGVPVKIEAGQVTETVQLIDWQQPEQNDFAIAEEVTLKGNHERRPDIVLYVNGIAIGVLELKNSRVSIGDGIRQLLSNQQKDFNEWFFTTVQIVFAGNDSEGLQYGAIKTEEKYFLKWKEDEADNSRFKLDKYLAKLCDSGETLDLKAYEADMRHLIDTYIEADEPRKISPFDNMGLLELIVKTGIANAIATQLGGMKGNKDAIAETIENNVRSKIIKERLNAPAFYEKMSTLLDEIIAARKARAIEYEEYLKRIAELAKTVEVSKGDDTPATLDTPGKRAIYNNLGRGGSSSTDHVAEPAVSYGSETANKVLELSLRIDEAIKRSRPDGWRGIQTREQVIKQALYDVLQDVVEVERIFLVIKAQREY